MQKNKKCQGTKPIRKPISKKMRFEIFKRDSFTCQYCGKKAPDVVLHIDHIKPVAAGGRNSLLNLVTSCIECNLGKGATELSDKSALERSREQAKMLQKRREQIEMMRDWQIGLVDEKNAAVEAVSELFCCLTGGKKVISEGYKQTAITKLVSKYGLAEVLDALRAGSESYGDPCKALSKLPGICHCRNDPATNQRVLFLNIMQKRFWNLNRAEASGMLVRGYKAGGEDFYHDLDILINQCRGTWYQVYGHFENLVEKWVYK